MGKSRGKKEYETHICTSNYVLMAVLAVLSVITLIISGCAGHGGGRIKTGAGTSAAWTRAFSSIPEYDGKEYIDINNGTPFFTEDEITSETYLSYSDHDSLGRCEQASACLSPETLVPQGTKRGAIGHIRPSGWHTVKYDCIYEKYLYNRCHLIAWSLSGTLDDERNLITGTKYLNLSMLYGMEYETLDYIRKTENHVMYRVTPVYEGDELLCRGLLMEAESVEDDGKGLMHCRYFFNVQPGIEIDYRDGTSRYSGVFADTDSPAVNADYVRRAGNPGSAIRDGTEKARDGTEKGENAEEAREYIVNTNTGRFHLAECPNAKRIQPQNRKNRAGPREKLLSEGYVPAGCCDP